MSKHEVKVVRISEIKPHLNADNLELTNIWGYQCVIRKGDYKLGDLAAFIEPDYECNVTEPAFSFLNDGRTEWKRITVKKIRGESSYGLLIGAPEGSKEEDNVIDLLKVRRWEPKPPPKNGMDIGICCSGPKYHVPIYDLENYKKYYSLFEDGEMVILQEKIHGTNSRFVFDGEKMFCGSRTTWKMEPETHVKDIQYLDEDGKEIIKAIKAPNNIWWQALKQNQWIESWCRNHPNMVLYGEIYGPNIQGKEFHYGKKQGEYGFAAFDIFNSGRWIDCVDMLYNPVYCEGLVEHVPVVYHGSFDMETLEDLAEEKSTFQGQKVREGIVIRPERERTNNKTGRTVLKYVSDFYLMMK